jgi:hypothetical protein
MKFGACSAFDILETGPETEYELTSSFLLTNNTDPAYWQNYFRRTELFPYSFNNTICTFSLPLKLLQTILWPFTRIRVNTNYAN